MIRQHSPAGRVLHGVPRRHIAGLLLAVLTAAASTARAEKERSEAGPPPFGYFRIVGDAVPNWRPIGPHERVGGGKLNWTFLGAQPIQNEYWSGDADASGRVPSIAVHPTQPDTAYAASASGGLWKTTDGGAHWTPLTDRLSSLNSGAVAIDPSDPETVYYGTGEWSTGATGDGLFRSTDGGANWTKIATTAQVGSTISRVVVNPSNSLIVHVGGNIGHVRSIDGGNTWSAAQLSNLSDLVINPATPSTLYAGRNSVGVYRSTDDGQTWVRLTTGLASSNVRRVNLAISASNPQVLYTGFINPSSGLRGFYQTTNGGTSWSQLVNTPDYPSPQGWYDHFVGCDPTDENVVYAGGVFPSYAVAGVIKSTDGGNSWTDVTIGIGGGQLHPDQHAIAFGSDGAVWIGNDGGVWKSLDGGTSWIDCNATLAVTQNYQIALHPTDVNRLMGGTQDNGTHARFADTLAWSQTLAGDGGFAAYDFDQPTRTYSTYVYLTVYRQSGFSTTEITGPWGSDSVGFIAPLIMDPNDAKVLLGGTNRVWRTLNARANPVTWTAISDSTVAGGGVLNAIAVARGASNTIYTGSTTGRVYVTTDAAMWANRSTGVPGSPVADVVLDPNDWQHVYIASYAAGGARVLETTDAGLNWVSRTGNLPVGLSGRALAVDWRPRTPGLYLGTGVGVYASYDGGATWLAETQTMPNVNVGDLAIDAMNDTLTAGTYGRGAWRTPLPCLRGDVDFDDSVSVDDIPPFVGALLSGTIGADLLCVADMNEDGTLNGDDVEPFVRELLGP